MFIPSGGVSALYYLRNYGVLLLVCILCCTPITLKIYERLKRNTLLRGIVLGIIFILTIAYMVDATNSYKWSITILIMKIFPNGMTKEPVRRKKWCSLRKVLNFILAVLCNALECFEHKVELTNVGKVVLAAVRTRNLDVYKRQHRQRAC